MNKATEHSNVKLAILKQLNISPRIYDRIMAYGAKGKNAFDVYTLYKSAAKRHPSEIVRIDDKLDMSCLAWMKEKEFHEAKRLLKRLGVIMEIVDLGDQGRPVIHYVKLLHHRIKTPKLSAT
ncbi:MAG TPA: hypothetical protein ENG28_04685 [Deltaproteobacteria bacterium]|nr:hypothetical protein [Deltaproteobacteria bacterium]